MLTKREIKKRILNYAHEQYREKKEEKSYMGYFNIQTLRDLLGATEGKTKYRFYEALHELFLQNVIMKDPYHENSSFSFTLTTKGKEIAEKKLDIDEYSLRLENFIENEELLDECQDDFNSGKYDKAIFSAYRLLEIKVRYKARLTADDFGTKLMSKAFKVSKGKLYIPSCETPSEEIGIQNLFTGAIGAFKNPQSHRAVFYENPRAALQVLMFSELLLNLIKIAKARDS